MPKLRAVAAIFRPENGCAIETRPRESGSRHTTAGPDNAMGAVGAVGAGGAGVGGLEVRLRMTGDSVTWI